MNWALRTVVHRSGLGALRTIVHRSDLSALKTIVHRLGLGDLRTIVHWSGLGALRTILSTQPDRSFDSRMMLQQKAAPQPSPFAVSTRAGYHVWLAQREWRERKLWANRPWQKERNKESKYAGSRQRGDGRSGVSGVFMPGR